MRFAFVSLPETAANLDLGAAPAPGSPSGAPAQPATKLDPQVSFVSVTKEGVFSFEVSAYDLTTHNRVNALHIVLYARGAQIPADASAAIADATTKNLPHFQTNAAAYQGGVMVPVDASAAPAGQYLAVAIVEFES